MKVLFYQHFYGWVRFLQPIKTVLLISAWASQIDWLKAQFLLEQMGLHLQIGFLKWVSSWDYGTFRPL